MNCNFYEEDTHAKAEHDREWESMPDYVKKQIEEESAYMEAHTPPRSPYKFDNLPCQEFCKHFVVQDGYPGETLYCCSHAENRQILDGDSVFNGMDDPWKIGRLLDAIC